MLKNTERFSDRVENYVKYRPSYPPEILGVLREKTFLRVSSVVADIGAGTGISSKIFLENGNRVYGVEPNAAMREAASVFLQDFGEFVPTDGTAEETNLPDRSVDFVVAFQAFHWFDLAKTRAEFRRILRPDGYAALVWNVRRLDSSEFLRDYERFVLEFGTDYKAVSRQKVTEEQIGEFFQGDFAKETFSISQILDLQAFKGRTFSSSYIPNEGTARFAEMSERLAELFAKHQKDGKIEITYDTKIYYSKL